MANHYIPTNTTPWREATSGCISGNDGPGSDSLTTNDSLCTPTHNRTKERDPCTSTPPLPYGTFRSQVASESPHISLEGMYIGTPPSSTLQPSTATKGRRLRSLHLSPIRFLPNSSDVDEGMRRRQEVSTDMHIDTRDDKVIVPMTRRELPTVSNEYTDKEDIILDYQEEVDRLAVRNIPTTPTPPIKKENYDDDDSGPEGDSTPEDMCYEDAWTLLCQNIHEQHAHYGPNGTTILANHMVKVGRSQGVIGPTIEMVLETLLSPIAGLHLDTTSVLLYSLIPRGAVSHRCVSLIIGRLHLPLLAPEIKILALDWLVMVYDWVNVRGGMEHLIGLLVHQLKSEGLRPAITRLLLVAADRQHVSHWLVDRVQHLPPSDQQRALIALINGYFPGLMKEEVTEVSSNPFASLNAEFMFDMWTIQQRCLNQGENTREGVVVNSIDPEVLLSVSLGEEALANRRLKVRRWLDRDLWVLTQLAKTDRRGLDYRPKCLSLRLVANQIELQVAIQRHLADHVLPNPSMSNSGLLTLVQWLLPFVPFANFSVLLSDVLDHVTGLEDTAPSPVQVGSRESRGIFMAAISRSLVRRPAGPAICSIQSYTETVCNWAQAANRNKDSLTAIDGMVWLYSLVKRVDRLVGIALGAHPNNTQLHMTVLRFYQQVLDLCSTNDLPFIALPSETVLTFLTMSSSTLALEDYLVQARAYLSWSLAAGMLLICSGVDPVPPDWLSVRASQGLVHPEDLCHFLSMFSAPAFSQLVQAYLLYTKDNPDNPITSSQSEVSATEKETAVSPPLLCQSCATVMFLVK
eukprot:Ihof_evm12s100 gene=Ihof_evmTU12s100